MPRGTSGICGKNRTRLDFADNRAACLVAKSGMSPGNVETTPIGFVKDGTLVEGYIPEPLLGDPCTLPVRRKTCGELC